MGTTKRNQQATKAALAYLAIKPRLERAFDAWAAATPRTEKAAEMEYRATLDQMRQATAR